MTAVGPEFFSLAIVSDRIRFDGIECLRLSDVRELQAPQEHASFVEAALKKRGERMPRSRVKPASVEQILTSANREFPLVTIHREKVEPDICQIGRVIGVSRGILSLLEIDPDARWESGPTDYRLREITRIGFGADYENALFLVGGPPPGMR